MATSHKLERQFVGITYPTVEALAKHADKISRVIIVKAFETRSRVPKTPMTRNRLASRIIPLVSRYANEGDLHRKIAEQLLIEENKPPSISAVKKRLVVVAAYLGALKNAGLIPTSPSYEFNKRIAEIAELYRTHMGGQYRNIAIVKALMAQEGNENPSEEELAKKKNKVYYALRTLKQMGKIPKSEKTLTQSKREPTGELQKQFSYVANAAIGRHSNWASFLGQNQVKEIASDGVIEALQKAPSLEKKRFESFAHMVIKRRIIDAVRKKGGRGKERRKMIEFNEKIATPPSTIDTASIERMEMSDKLEALHALHKQGQIQPPHLMIWTLKHIYGYSGNHLATHFKISESRVSQILREMREKLARAE